MGQQILPRSGTQIQWRIGDYMQHRVCVSPHRDPSSGALYQSLVTLGGFGEEPSVSFSLLSESLGCKDDSQDRCVSSCRLVHKRVRTTRKYKLVRTSQPALAHILLLAFFARYC